MLAPMSSLCRLLLLALDIFVSQDAWQSSAARYLLLVSSNSFLTAKLLTIFWVGGTYGFVRGILNPYWGYIAGNFEVYVNLVALSSIIIAFGDSCSQVMGLPVSMQPVTWPILLIASGIIHAYGNQIFWTFSDVLTVISLIILVLFVVLSVQHLDLNQYEQPEKAQPDIQHTIGFTSLTSLFYCAIELLPVVAHEAAEVTLSVSYHFSSFLVILL